MFHLGKIQETKHFSILAPFRPFLGKLGKNSATYLYSRLHFYSAPLSYVAEESASWEHCHCHLAEQLQEQLGGSLPPPPPTPTSPLPFPPLTHIFAL
jgi:hypothetical protein